MRDGALHWIRLDFKLFERGNSDMHKSLRLTIVNVLVTSFFVIGMASQASATITIQLQNAFIDKYANRATIDTNVTVDVAAPRPHTASQDGDMHGAGRSADIGLATVVEIMNAGRNEESN